MLGKQLEERRVELIEAVNEAFGTIDDRTLEDEDWGEIYAGLDLGYSIDVKDGDIKIEIGLGDEPVDRRIVSLRDLFRDEIFPCGLPAQEFLDDAADALEKLAGDVRGARGDR